MNIAVNTRFLLSNTLEGYGYYLKEMLSRLVANHPEHQFIFIFDRPYSNEFVQAPNITPVIAGPPARHPLLWKWWYDIRIPAVLKKYKADVFLSGDGFCSLATSVPQCLVIHDLAFLHHPSFIYRSHLLYYRRYTPKFLKKASSIVTVSQFSKEDIVSKYKTDPAAIDVIYNAARSSMHPLSWQEKQSVTHEYTGGKNYFIYAGSIHPRKNLVNLLKAFSIFKKRQKSDWKLVIAGRAAWQSGKFMDSISSYKYRGDLVMTGYTDDQKLTQLIGAAYAMVYPSLFEGFGMPVVEAMQAGVPVITSKDSAMQEIGGDAALYADPTDHEDIADKMMRIYKDEALRDRLIQAGLEKAAEYDWERSAEMLWASILKAVHRKN
ncbi:MAG: glycosyltransferase family 4 protein [Chitinophagaceae bacterium]|nr:glycosyltransferase family 4 protein [Chitinophagaceae bacterium]